MNSAQDTLAGGLPHSEIPGSPIARISPGLFAACHVLHRLSVPRHPPDALASRLIIAPPPRTGPNPVPPRNSGERRSLMKTLLSDSQAKLCSPRPVRLGHHNSLFTLQPTPPRSPAAVSLNLLRTSRAPLGRTLLAQRTGSISGCSPAAPVGRKTHALARLGFSGGGGERIRTDDLLLAKQALSQLSYTPAPGIRRPQTGHHNL